MAQRELSAARGVQKEIHAILRLALLYVVAHQLEIAALAGGAVKVTSVCRLSQAEQYARMPVVRLAGVPIVDHLESRGSQSLDLYSRNQTVSEGGVTVSSFAAGVAVRRHALNYDWVIRSDNTAVAFRFSLRCGFPCAETGV